MANRHLFCVSALGSERSQVKQKVPMSKKCHVSDCLNIDGNMHMQHECNSGKPLKRFGYPLPDYTHLDNFKFGIKSKIQDNFKSVLYPDSSKPTSKEPLTPNRRLDNGHLNTELKNIRFGAPSVLLNKRMQPLILQTDMPDTLNGIHSLSEGNTINTQPLSEIINPGSLKLSESVDTSYGNQVQCFIGNKIVPRGQQLHTSSIEFNEQDQNYIETIGKSHTKLSTLRNLKRLDSLKLNNQPKVFGAPSVKPVVPRNMIESTHKDELPMEEVLYPTSLYIDNYCLSIPCTRTQLSDILHNGAHINLDTSAFHKALDLLFATNDQATVRELLGLLAGKTP